MTDRTGITLRLRPEEREALETLKTYLGEPSASRALLHVVRLYPQQHQALQDALNELAQARADRQDLHEAVSAAEQTRLDLSNTVSRIAGRTADATTRNRSLVLAHWLCSKGILSAGIAAECAGIPATVLRYRMGYFQEDPAFDLPPDRPARDTVTGLRLAINDTLINRNPNIMSGAPVIMGTRVPVSMLFDHLSGGYTLDYFVDHYPSVSRELAVRFLELATKKLTEDTEPELHEAGQQKKD